MLRREQHSMTRVLTRGAVALSGTALILFSGNAVVSARMAPPAGSASPHDVGAPQSPAQTAPEAPQQTEYVPAPVTVVPPAPQSDRAPAAHPAHNRHAVGHSRPNDIIVVPAPASGARADVVKLDPLDTCISCTAAGAGPNGSKAGAIAVRLLGNNIAAGHSASTSGDHGALIAIPANPLLNLAIADWTTRARATDDSSSSFARAALVDLRIGGDQTSRDGVLSVAVLEAVSEARWTGAVSHGAGENNGVRVAALDDALVIILLHSDASSDHSGKTYIASINRAELLSSDQTGPQGIPIDIPGVVRLGLLQVGAIGGVGTTAEVGTVNDLLGGKGQTAGALTAAAEGSAGVAGPNAPAAQPPGTGSAGAAAAKPPTTASTGAVHVPSTGAAMGLGGLILLVAGSGALVAALRRRRDA
jgi:hypothetical protein